MRSFLLALQFLTIIPIRIKSKVEEAKLSQAVVYFPLIGILLGLILTGVNIFLSSILLPRFLISVILVVLLIILTGGLHLDGLADTFDAFLSRKKSSQMLQIMRDSRIGTMGVLAIISLILIKLALIFSLDAKAINVALILMCVLSRYSLVFSMFLFSYAREQGKAKIFIEGMNFKIFFLATLISLLCSIFLSGLKGLSIFIMVIIFSFLAGKFVVNKIGGITGDTLGAISELEEVFVLLNILILTKLFI